MVNVFLDHICFKKNSHLNGSGKPETKFVGFTASSEVRKFKGY